MDDVGRDTQLRTRRAVAVPVAQPLQLVDSGYSRCKDNRMTVLQAHPAHNRLCPINLRPKYPGEGEGGREANARRIKCEISRSLHRAQLQQQFAQRLKLRELSGLGSRTSYDPDSITDSDSWVDTE